MIDEKFSEAVWALVETYHPVNKNEYRSLYYLVSQTLIDAEDIDVSCLSDEDLIDLYKMEDYPELKKEFSYRFKNRMEA